MLTGASLAGPILAVLTACGGGPDQPRFDAPAIEVALPCDERFDVQDDPSHTALYVGYGYLRGIGRIGDDTCDDPATSRLRRSERARLAGLKYLRETGRTACEITASDTATGGMEFRYACKGAAGSTTAGGRNPRKT